MLLWAAPAVALAEAAPRFQLQINSCVQVNYREVGQHIALHLRAQLVDSYSVGTLVVTVNCQNRFVEIRVDDPQTKEPLINTVNPKPAVELRIEDPFTGKTLRRVVDLLSAPAERRSRLLAVAITELVSASWLELTANPEPEVPPLEKMKLPQEQQLIRRNVLQQKFMELGLVAEVHRFVSLHQPLFGGGLRFERVSGENFFWGGGAAMSSTKVPRSAGDIHLLLSTFEFVLGLQQRVDFVRLQVAVGARLGAVLASAEAQKSDRVAGGSAISPWGGPLLRAGAAFDFLYNFSLRLDVEGVVALYGFRARLPDAKDVRLTGWSVTPQLGVSWRF